MLKDKVNFKTLDSDKYLELIKLTEGMNHTEVKNFLASWNILNPDKAACYTSLYNAKKNYINNGADALISKKNQCGRKLCVEQKYYEYYKNQVDMRLITVDTNFLYKIDDIPIDILDKINIIIKNNNIYLELKAELNDLEMMNLLENSQIVYNE